MSTFTSLRAAVSAKLATITELAYVDDVHHTNLEGFPAATFEPSALENIYITTADNERRHVFQIIIHQEMEVGGRENAITVLAAAVDAVVTAFDEDFNLGGAADFCLALPSSWGEYTTGGGAYKYATLQLTCVTETLVNP